MNQVTLLIAGTTLVIAILVGLDAEKRGSNGWGWGISVFLFAIIALPLYIIIRLVQTFSSRELAVESAQHSVETECIATDQNLIVYSKTHESSTIIQELEIGTSFHAKLKADFGRFIKVRLADGQIGYISTSSKYTQK